MTTDRLALIAGIRTPFCKAGGPLAGHTADDLGAFAVRELMVRSGFSAADLDELVMGCVAQPAEAANLARVVALKAGLPTSLIASTVHRNCASGMEAVSTAYAKIFSGEAKVILCGGTESMSNIPLYFNRKMTGLFGRLMKAKTTLQKLGVWAGFRPAMLTPIIGVQVGLTDPVAGLNMGQTAENLAKEFQITRAMQDEFAILSHHKAVAARARLAEEFMVVPSSDRSTMVTMDDGPRDNLDPMKIAGLKPYFDKLAGTVTVGNACPLTDGAGAFIAMKESEAKARGLVPLGYVRAYAYAALDGARMGLGPVYAAAKLFDRTGLGLKDFDLIEINEAFAAQVLACTTAFASNGFSKKFLNRPDALGTIDPAKLNVNGGAIALGHPVGASGARLLLTSLHELRRRGGGRALATLCIGGGQGAAFVVETA